MRTCTCAYQEVRNVCFSCERIKSMNPSNTAFYFEAFQYTKFSSHHLIVQNQQLKHQRNVWNLFKVNNRGTRTTPLEIYLFEGEFSKKNVISRWDTVIPRNDIPTDICLFKLNNGNSSVWNLFKVKGNAQLVKNTTLRKNDSSTPKNVVQNTNECTCDYLRYVTLLICLRWSVVSFWGVIRNIF